MRQKQRDSYRVLVLFLLISLFLVGCHPTKKIDDTKKQASKETVTLKKIPIETDSFKKVIGWLNDEEVLIHCGYEFKDVLYRFNVKTGKLHLIYQPNALILIALLSPDQTKIFIQLAHEKDSEIQVINLSGEKLQTKTVDTMGYLNVSWNPVSLDQIFLSYYQNENKIVVSNWDIGKNTTKEVPSDTLNPVWYSENLYVYVNNQNDFLLKKGELYLGDIRTGESTHLRNQVSGFYLNQDSLVMFTPSDFNDNDLLVSYQYPFMVDKGFLEVPKMTMNDRLVFPYLTQLERKSAIYGVLPKETVHLELTAGKFHLAKLNFEKRKVETIVDLPDNAPILISPDGKSMLYGWRFESIINLENKKIDSLLKDKGTIK
ncbi:MULTISPECIES: YqgU-like beta propeller domain-containing protein [Carnobacterium]|uniref:YqgU-like 6-bladed beta-propeller domain-containing protein n=1 Tax=Carnobacterium divergens TaxID=2748 RepID=A0A2R8A1Z9_CARDV|nr:MULTISPECIES: hypothetical protein [Carnobacterium]MCO6017382.1 hypothetical protein [Carnobacterium divergens]MDT1939204.1 hypothetical protein [Carnobacterium divergens]MDT1941642.1 hypothetical protein [Carnobacterium divergens]MDT1947440.1 hypothetical protein [Carnobacterium divergens]MDT1949879.1 hypothetical protein [Carnobacterium divergens]